MQALFAARRRRVAAFGRNRRRVVKTFARAVGEFGSIVLISGNIPFDTQVASMFIFKQIESDNPIGAAAISVVLLVISLVILIGIRALGRWGARYDR